jgi:hypothetical protein
MGKLLESTAAAAYRMEQSATVSVPLAVHVSFWSQAQRVVKAYELHLCAVCAALCYNSPPHHTVNISHKYRRGSKTYPIIIRTTSYGISCREIVCFDPT